jgi:hypothetical protein
MAKPCTAPAIPRPRVRASRSPATAPLLSAIIVNYRRWEETTALAEQLAAQDHIFADRLEVLVVDNASPASPLETKIADLPRTQLMRLPENVGFAAGVNAGFARSRGRWILVLNPDVVLGDGFVDSLASMVLEREGESGPEGPAGILGFRLRNRDQTHQYSTGRFPTLARMVLGLLRPRPRRKYQSIDAARRQQAPWVTGSCMLVRRSCLRQLGGFDERFFLYYEDVDVCLRAQQKGWSVWYEPDLSATHLDPLQNRAVTPPMRAICRHASLTYFQKHLGGWRFRALARLVQIEAAMRLAWANLRGRSEEAAVVREVIGLCKRMRRGDDAGARAHLLRVLQYAGMVRAESAALPDAVEAGASSAV